MLKLGNPQDKENPGCGWVQNEIGLLILPHSFNCISSITSPIISEINFIYFQISIKILIDFIITNGFRNTWYYFKQALSIHWHKWNDYVFLYSLCSAHQQSACSMNCNCIVTRQINLQSNAYMYEPVWKLKVSWKSEIYHFMHMLYSC